MKLPSIQWDVVWSVLRTLLVAGGPVATLLIALGFPPIQVSYWLGVGLAAVGVAAVVVPGIIGALKRTDSSKIAEAAALPDVEKIVVKDTAVSPGVVAVVQDTAQPKVVPQSAV